jgi:hypothetical protein
MANLTHTLCNEGAVEIDGAEFRDETLTFPGADDYLAGTLLARRAVALTPVAVAGSNTGTGTCTALSVVTGPEVPLVGAYVLTCITAVANGGVFKLVDPNGRIVGAYLPMTAGAGAATVFKVGGLQFTLTDAGTDFIAGDSFTITVAADGKLVIYSPSGAGGVQRPCALLTYPVSKAGSGDVPVRALVAGKVNKKRLVIDADGDDSNITNDILDQLRARGITAIDVKQLSAYDNQ